MKCEAQHATTLMKLLYGENGYYHCVEETKTVSQVICKKKMCPLMVEDIELLMHGESWIWQQDGAEAPTANDTVTWLPENTPDLSSPTSGHPSQGLSVMDYRIWSLLLKKVQFQREINDITDKKLEAFIKLKAFSFCSFTNCTERPDWSKRCHCLQFAKCIASLLH